MATTIRIKRSTTSNAPSSLATGELAYSAGVGLYNDGGDRLYFGKGDDGSGNATSIEVIGGAYFANLADHAPGTLTASSAIITDANNKVDRILIDNITIDGNTISTTDTNGDLVLDPSGTGSIDVSGALVTNAADPVGNTDLVTLGYLNTQLSTSITFTISDGSTTDEFNANTGTLQFIGDSTEDVSGVRTVVSDDKVTFSLTHNSFTIGSDEVKLGQTITDLNGITALDVDFVSIDSDSITTTGGSGYLNLRQETRVHSPVSKAAGDSSVSVFDVVDVNGDQLFQVAQNGDATIGGVLTVQGSGVSTFTGDVDIGGVLTVQNGALITADMTGEDMLLTGNLTVNGNTTLGDSASNDNITFGGRITSDIIPDSDNTYDLGSPSLRWAQVHGVTANIGNVTISGNTIGNTDTNGILYIDPNPIDSDAGELVIRGNLTVQGTQTIVNSTSVSINDKNIVLADSAANATEADGAGLTVGGDIYSGTKATITYDGATDRWDFNKDIDVAGSTLSAIKVGGTNLNELIDDHLASNLIQVGIGLDIAYNDGANTLTFSGELATKSNAGIASFDSDQFSFSGAENLTTIYQLDGGTY